MTGIAEVVLWPSRDASMIRRIANESCESQSKTRDDQDKTSRVHVAAGRYLVVEDKFTTRSDGLKKQFAVFNTFCGALNVRFTPNKFLMTKLHKGEFHTRNQT
jgi:hypothetical protein